MRRSIPTVLTNVNFTFLFHLIATRSTCWLLSEPSIFRIHFLLLDFGQTLDSHFPSPSINFARRTPPLYCLGKLLSHFRGFFLGWSSSSPMNVGVDRTVSIIFSKPFCGVARSFPFSRVIRPATT